MPSAVESRKHHLTWSVGARDGDPPLPKRKPTHKQVENTSATRARQHSRVLVNVDEGQELVAHQRLDLESDDQNAEDDKV